MSDQPIPTPDQLDAEADQLDAAAAAYAKRSKQLRAAARVIRELQGVPLTSGVTYDTSNRMMSSTLAPGPSRGPVPDKDGPATKVMKDLGFSNLAELAKALGERHGTVRSWNLREDGLPERVLPAVEKLRQQQSKRTGRGK